ncbi:MAG: beta-ketoacyl-ACP synthase II [Anaerolineae bacterium]|nr:beta-ketoacyl-ACP synthase II [Anaerolineae bacterium]
MDWTRDGFRRVVVTGMGAFTALGTVQSMWDRLKEGISGIHRISTFEPKELPIKVAGEIPDFEPTQYIDRKEARRMARSSQLAVAAAKMAVDDAGLTEEDTEAKSERIGVAVGTGLGGYEILATQTHEFLSFKKRINPFGLVSGLPNMPAHYVSRFHHATGPITAISTACATGTQSIGAGADMIRLNQADVAIVGGVESVIADYAFSAFDAMTVLVRGYEDAPEKASRPFDRERNGFVYSEGVGILVLESLESAVKRGARIYAELLGYGVSSDGIHVAALDEEGKGPARAMRWALQSGHTNPDEVDYINAHGTSTVANDAVETTAIKSVFGSHAYNLWVSSTKSMLGHAMAASGAIEAIVAIKTLMDQVVHPTINLLTPDPQCDLDYVPNTAREAGGKLKRVLSNSFGLGGQNATALFGTI